MSAKRRVVAMLLLALPAPALVAGATAAATATSTAPRTPAAADAEISDGVLVTPGRPRSQTRATTVISPPPRPGSWHQLGATASSRPGKPLHFYRTAVDPVALAIVVVSPSSRRVHVFWSSYCVLVDDDTGEQSDQGIVSGVRRVIAYPPVLEGATRCYLWVNAKIRGRARVSAAEFAY